MSAPAGHAAGPTYRSTTRLTCCSWLVACALAAVATASPPKAGLYHTPPASPLGWHSVIVMRCLNYQSSGQHTTAQNSCSNHDTLQTGVLCLHCSLLKQVHTCGRRCGIVDAIRTLAENASNMPSTVRGTPPPLAPHSSTPYLPASCRFAE
jgi:hypothetical protein